jgi:NAD(P)-dependent dehydrogenase (short-subunit alcohol dehydrogenase family)
VYLSEHADAQETEALVKAEGRKCLLFAGDVGEAKTCDDVVAKTVDALGGLWVVCGLGWVVCEGCGAPRRASAYEKRRFNPSAHTKNNQHPPTNLLGRLDVLVNNAGIRLYQTIVDASAESWDQILAVNLKSFAFCSKAAIPLMRRSGGGSIVNLASVRSITAGGNTLQYDTTKAAIAGLTRGMAMDHSPEGIRVNAVCPGPIFTPFHARRIAAAGQSVKDYNDDAATRTMLRRPGTAEEVASCILFLASDDASYVTAASLYVDGGMTAM